MPDEDGEPTLTDIYGSQKRTEGMVQDMHTTMYGPQGEPHKGHVVRLDRLEQDSKRSGKRADEARRWGLGALLAAIVAGIKAFMGTK